MVDRIILHAGTEKTGTTAIQNALFESKAELGERGVLVPSTLDFGGPHIRLTTACLDYDPKAPLLAGFDFSDQDSFRLFQDDTRKDLRSEICAGNAHTLIVSDEHINVHLNTPKLLGRIPEMMGRPAEIIHPVIFFRRQDRLLEAMISEALKTLAIKHYGLSDPVSALKVIRYRFDYVEIIRTFSEVFPQKNLIIRGYESSQDFDIIQQFSDCVGIELQRRNEPISANRSVPMHLMEPLWNVGQIVLDSEYESLRAEWRTLVEGLANDFPGPPFRLKRNDALRWLDRFTSSNKWLVDHFPELDTILYPTTQQFIEPTNANLMNGSGLDDIADKALKHLSKKAGQQFKQAITSLTNRNSTMVNTDR